MSLSLFSNSFSFGPRFLHDHAGHIITDPRIAIVELVANSYDAGATLVEIRWPKELGGTFQISDNGTGMSFEEFNRRWKTLSYSRPLEQGIYVEYPPEIGNKKRASKRIGFGQNGKGRYGPFCFADEYEVETWKEGYGIRVKVSLARGEGEPFHCELISRRKKAGHGTHLKTIVNRNPLSESEISDAVGSKFLVDPFFSVSVNNKKLALFNLSSIASSVLQVGSYGELTIHQIDALVQDRTTLLRGITWWVNRRMVGNPSWDVSIGIEN